VTVSQVFMLPDLGEGLTEASLVRWMVAVGDEIAVDQAIAEVETAKSVVEVPSPYAGTVETLHGAEGDALVVGEPLLTVAAQSRAGSGNVLVGYGTSDTAHTGRRRRRRVATAGDRPANGGTATIAVISPVVRQLAKTRGLDLATVHPSGTGGVITRHDVEDALAQGAGAAGSNQAARSPAAPNEPAPNQSAPSGADARTGLPIRSTTQLTLFRKTVAATMSRSRAEIPEATVWVDVDATDLRELRRRIRIGDKHPSFTALIGRFTITALQKYPMLAGRLSADASELTEFEGINLGFAADTPRGLVVPVVRRADALTLRALDGELERLTSAARAGTATPSELSGSTFTINNYGTLGVDGSAAIINYPEVAILGIGRMLERPWVVDGQIVPRSIVQLSLVFDHRVCDGGVAAGFVRMIADAIEHPYDAFADL